ncbi:O-acetyl-ADP-ribose deacetylase [Kordia sp. YSTF-M3]|uniref:O-acetyl-ADP-ribose deacetylase n=1 Tax=Kordia aestuariivivens TaxID=2759037 RepID=A0ABR7Q6I0_9FLAO|nr:O-acetyl-ADP-ribose deacetylase [Kordia aestuariivivens]MBC8754164.1 O-acetyl-ADP-ribose deacetylase [Kordia aestuariivivens]
MNIHIIQSDITTLKVDAIVNAANSSLLGGGGVDGAIHRKGGLEILEACKKIRARQGKCKTGKAVITTAGKLPSNYVIHTVGPVWNTGGKDKEKLLANCYKNSLDLAVENNIKSIAFPNISTGIYRFPKKLAAEIALKTVTAYEHINKIDDLYFCCFDQENFEMYQELIKK